MEQTTVERAVADAIDDLVVHVDVDGDVLHVGVWRVGHDGHAPRQIFNRVFV